MQAGNQVTNSAQEQAGSAKQELLIKAEHLRFSYGDGNLRQEILCGINLEVRSNEIVILTGPSGSGKSTLLTLLGGLRSLHDGKLEVLGTQLCGAGSDELSALRKKIGFIFQAHNLLACLTARQNVRMALELQENLPASIMAEQVDEILSEVGLADHMNHYPKSLSGGQKQRVAIARALVNKPKLILADEPTSALDKKSGRDVVSLMQKLARERACAIVLVTHDSRILDIADRIVSMEDGCISEESLIRM